MVETPYAKFELNEHHKKSFKFIVCNYTCKSEKVLLKSGGKKSSHGSQTL